MNSTALHPIQQTTPRPLARAAAALAAGGFAWLAKMAVIAATDGAVSGIASTTASIFYFLGVALMVAGLTALAVVASAGRHVGIRVIAGISGFISFFFIFVIVEGIAKAIAGDAGPSWLADEAGILATGALLMTAGLLVVRRVNTR